LKIEANDATYATYTDLQAVLSIKAIPFLSYLISVLDSIILASQQFFPVIFLLSLSTYFPNPLKWYDIF
jgi:hypothetical protein